jgi:hypothetical protein
MFKRNSRVEPLLPPALQARTHLPTKRITLIADSISISSSSTCL